MGIESNTLDRIMKQNWTGSEEERRRYLSNRHAKTLSEVDAYNLCRETFTKNPSMLGRTSATMI
jgi:hypothetical protein